MKLLSPRIHGYIDIVFVVALTLAPMLLRFGPAAAAICYSTAAIHLVVSLMTDYPLGVAKRIPFYVHGAVEFAIGVGLLGAPWLFAFSELIVARNFFVVTGLAVVLIFAMTSYGGKIVTKAAPYDRYGH
jgi:hypothetical protein